MRTDQNQIDRDELVVGRRIERDAEREPRLHRHPRCVSPNPAVKRQAFQAWVQDSVNAAHDVTDLSRSIAIPCPSCSGPVYAPKDSHGERIDCAWCESKLVTRRDIADGVSLAALESDGAA